jgi:hypothetical protein
VWPVLTPHARLVAPDLSGCGGSPLGGITPTVEGYRAWLLGFLDACRIGRAAVAGLSLGAAVAVRTALDAPHRVEKLALLGDAVVHGQELAGLSCPVLLLPGADHRLPGDAPEQVATELVGFLGRGGAGGQYGR